MTDIIDEASNKEIEDREKALRQRKEHPHVKPTGQCLNCYRPVAAGRRWCSRACADEWEQDNK